VDIVQQPDTPATIYNIPVTFIGEDTLTDEGLMITQGKDTTVTLKLEGPRSAISQLDRSNITISVQAASQISEEGNYSLIYTVSLPSSVSDSGISVVSRSVDAIDVTVVQTITKTVDIVGRFSGTAAEDALISENDFEFEQKTVTVSGERSLVEQVDYALVTLDVQDLDATWSGELPIVLMDAKGNEVVADSDSLICDISSVYTIFPVRIVKVVPLTVDFLDGGGATASDATAVIDPVEVTISGTPERLAEIDSINLGTVDLSQIVTSGQMSMDINVPDGVSVISGISTAKVTVTVDGDLKTRMVQTSDIQLINVPEGVDATLITQAIEVRIRGTASSMDLMLDEDVYVVADLANVDASALGTRTVTATVYVRGFADIGSVGNYEVVVSLAKTD
jgi:YbbR domain-containing protein